MVDRTQVQEKIHCVRYPKSYGLYVWVWRMLEVLVKGERRGGRAPVCAPGAAAFLGSWLSAHGGARGAHQLGTGVPEAVGYLGGTYIIYFLMLDSMLVNLSLF